VNKKKTEIATCRLNVRST